MSEPARSVAESLNGFYARTLMAAVEGRVTCEGLNIELCRVDGRPVFRHLKALCSQGLVGYGVVGDRPGSGGRQRRGAGAGNAGLVRQP